jgi:hypothetical protein
MQTHFQLSSYPDYFFAEDGTAVRKEPIQRGPTSGQTEVPSFYCEQGIRRYRLYNAEGRRTSVRKDHLAQAIRDQRALDSLNLTQIPGFDVYFADQTGIPYSIRRSGTLHKIKHSINGDQIRYSLYDSARKRRTLSAASILRLIKIYKNNAVTA